MSSENALLKFSYSKNYVVISTPQHIPPTPPKKTNRMTKLTRSSATEQSEIRTCTVAEKKSPPFFGDVCDGEYSSQTLEKLSSSSRFFAIGES